VAVWAIHTLDNGSKGRALAIVTGNAVQARLATADTANSVLALPAGKRNQNSKYARRLDVRRAPE